MELHQLNDRAVFDEAQRVLHEASVVAGVFDARLLVAVANQLIELNYDKPKQLDLIVDIVRALYVSGRADHGLELCERAKGLALEIDDARSTAQILLLLGVCAADTGNLPLAMEAYRDSLSISQRTQNALLESKTWHNLGAALTYGGLYREAIGCFHKSLEVAENVEELQSSMIGAYVNIAGSYLNLEEIALGLVAIKKAQDSLRIPQTSHEMLNRVLAENYYTRLLIEVDDFDGALEHAKEARHYAGLSKSPRADITASVAEGLAQVFSGQADIGITLLTRTYERAKVLKLPTREVLGAIVKAHEHIGQHDRALEYLQQMLLSQKATQEANVLRHVKRHLEQLHMKEGATAIEDGKQAIKRWETKREVLEGRIAKRDMDEARRELFRLSVEGLERLAVATELRDDSTGEHSYRVGRLASMLAKEAGCNDDFVFMIDIAARLHDIGKIAIPDGILLKPGPFNDSEREIMKMHAEAGADVLAKSNIQQINMAEVIARHHHERWDGQGYPAGLSGEAIPLAARITALADVFDALTHARTYKHAWSVQSALEEIAELRGTHFDPRLTGLFLALITRLQHERHDLDTLLGEAARKSSFNQAKSKIWDSLKLAKEEYKAKSTRTVGLLRR
jgi:putative two-component system response regulator